MSLVPWLGGGEGGGEHNDSHTIYMYDECTLLIDLVEFHLT